MGIFAILNMNFIVNQISNQTRPSIFGAVMEGIS